MEKTNALAVVNGGNELEIKKALYNLAASAEVRLSDMLNNEFIVKAMTFSDCDVTNRETGELERRERVLVVDSDGNTYHSVAGGLVTSCKQFAQLFGVDKNGLYTFDDEIITTVKKKDTPHGHTFILSIVK